ASASRSAAISSTRAQAASLSWATRSGLSAVRVEDTSGRPRHFFPEPLLHFMELANAAAEVLLGAELGLQEGVDQLHGQLVADDLGAEAHHVDVVVLDALVRRVHVVAERGADAGDLVGGDAGADAGAA